MSTAFPFTFPRRIALSTGLRLIEWARRPDASATASVTAHHRRALEVERLALEEALTDHRQRHVDRYLSEVRQVL